MTMGQRVTGHGSSGSTNLSGSRWSRISTRDPLAHNQVNKIPRTGCFVAVMMFDFERTSTQWSWLETATVGSHDSWVVVSRGPRVTRVTGQKVWPIVISARNSVANVTHGRVGVGDVNWTTALNVLRLWIFRQRQSWVVENSIHISHSRRDATKQFSRVGSGGLNYRHYVVDNYEHVKFVYRRSSQKVILCFITIQ